MGRLRRLPRITRSTVIFAAGLAGIYHETAVHTGPERIGLIFLFGSMIGLPAFLYRDDRVVDKQQRDASDGEAQS